MELYTENQTESVSRVEASTTAVLFGRQKMSQISLNWNVTHPLPLYVLQRLNCSENYSHVKGRCSHQELLSCIWVLFVRSSSTKMFARKSTTSSEYGYMNSGSNKASVIRCPGIQGSWALLEKAIFGLEAWLYYTLPFATRKSDCFTLYNLKCHTESTVSTFHVSVGGETSKKGNFKRQIN